MLRRAARALRIGKEKYFVGKDLEGNSFYERPSLEDPTDWRHAKRSIEYLVEKPLSDYGFTTIPVQWSSWMRRTRRDPPTLLELEIDAARQARLQNNVEGLALEYKEEKERLRLEEGNLRSEGIGARQLAEGGQQPSAPAAEREEEKPALGDELLAAKTKKAQEEEREAAKRRREEFAKANPTFHGKGNPSDQHQPESWTPSAAAPRPRRGK